MKNAAVEFSNNREDLPIEPNFWNCGGFRHTRHRYAHKIVSPKRPGHIKEEPAPRRVVLTVCLNASDKTSIRPTQRD
jgi:hypothetical protein